MKKTLTRGMSLLVLTGLLLILWSVASAVDSGSKAGNGLGDASGVGGNSSAQQGAFNAQEKTTYTYYSEDNKLLLQVIWNDNNNEEKTRPTCNDGNYKQYFSENYQLVCSKTYTDENGQEQTVLLTEEQFDKETSLTLSSIQPTRLMPEDDIFSWTYEFYGGDALPTSKTVTKTDIKRDADGTPVLDADGEPVTESTVVSACTYTYGFKQKTLPAGYWMGNKNDGTEQKLMNTTEVEQSSIVQWKDNDNLYETRISAANYLAKKCWITQKDSSGKQVIFTDTVVENTDNCVVGQYMTITNAEGDGKSLAKCGKWSIAIHNLPEYDETGEPYEYTFWQGDEDTTTQGQNRPNGLSTSYEVGKIETNLNGTVEYINSVGGIYETTTEEGTGQLVNTLTNKTWYHVEKEWKDAANTDKQRPNGTLYLYRVAEAEDGGVVSDSDIVQYGEHDALTFYVKDKDGKVIAYTNRAGMLFKEKECTTALGSWDDDYIVYNHDRTTLGYLKIADKDTTVGADGRVHAKLKPNSEGYEIYMTQEDTIAIARLIVNEDGMTGQVVEVAKEASYDDNNNLVLTDKLRFEAVQTDAGYVNDSSPVSGFDKATVPKDMDSGVSKDIIMGYSNHQPTLDMYDTDGCFYVYYGIEVLDYANTTYRYKTIVSNAEGETAKYHPDTLAAASNLDYALSGAKITNALVAEIEISPTKRFHAQAMQSISDTSKNYVELTL